MLAILHALVHAMVDVPVPLLFLGNVGEEGEGDLRGVATSMARVPWPGVSRPI